VKRGGLVRTELVQTDVMVFDRKGLFVDGLKSEQFALKIDNKPQTIAFFAEDDPRNHTKNLCKVN